MSVPRILITNAYSAKNKGDAGIIQGMIRDLRDNSLLKNAEVTISSADFEGDRHAYDVPALERSLWSSARINAGFHTRFASSR